MRVCKRSGAALATAVPFLVLLLAGCSPLQQFKSHWSDQDYRWIAARQIECSPAEPECSQLHLIKGDACYRLASRRGPQQRSYLKCAATHLARGIRMTESWQVGSLDLERTRTYINLCETLRSLRDMRTGASAERAARELLRTARELRSLEPDHPASVYYAGSARYALLQPELLDPSHPGQACAELRSILNDLRGAAPGARNTEFEPLLQRLRLDVRGAMQTLPDCPPPPSG